MGTQLTLYLLTQGLHVFGEESLSFDEVAPAVSRNSTAVDPRHIWLSFRSFKGKGCEAVTRKGGRLLEALFAATYFFKLDIYKVLRLGYQLQIKTWSWWF